MKKYLQIAIIAIAACMLCSFSGSNVTTTEYYYFQLTPNRPDMPYYISQTLGIDYVDHPDLMKQQKNYIHELNVIATKDGYDTLRNFKKYIPQGTYAQAHCEEIRVAAIKALNGQGKDVKYTSIY